MRKIGKWLIGGGALLILCSVGLVLFGQLSATRAQSEAANTLAHIDKRLPPPTVGTPDALSSMQMPTLAVNGTDVAGILEIPSLQLRLPVGNAWESRSRTSFPRRFAGSVYDGSLSVGGYDQKGQFDCLKSVDIGTVATITDMTGARFSYEVTDILRKTSVEAETLTSVDADLTLFVREAYSMGYIVVCCTRQGAT